MDHSEVIRAFYNAFGRRDAAGMMRCYHPAAEFSDPVFHDLSRDEIAAMWTMLCKRGVDLQITLVTCETQGDRGRANWEAKYTFAKTKRYVHNKVRSSFVFADDLIREQHDDFDFWRWSSMALGLSGRLLGWTPLIKRAVHHEAMRALNSFRATQPITYTDVRES